MPKRLKLIAFFALCLGLAVLIGRAIRGDLKSAERQAILCGNTAHQKIAYLYLNQLDSSTRTIKGNLMISGYPSTKNDGPEQSFVLEYMTPDPSGSGSTGDEIRLVQGTNLVWHKVDLPYESKPFFYPFESYDVNLRFTFMENGVPIPLQIQLTNFIDELVVDGGCLGHLSFEKPAVGLTDISFNLERHRFVRLISVVLYSVAIIFLIYIARRKEGSEILTNSLGYIAALWGIRQIIVGYAKLFPTMVDLTTLALYVVVVGIVAYRLLFTPPEPVETPDEGD